MGSRDVDLILIDCSMPEMDGYDFTQWLRREAPPPVRYTPMILLTGHAAQSRVHKGRDCGGQLHRRRTPDPGGPAAADPVRWAPTSAASSSATPTSDPTVACATSAPMGMAGRRSGDLSEHVGAATGENMDQSDIDMLMKPMKVSL